MPLLSQRLRRVAQFLLCDAGAIPLFVAVYISAGVVLVLTDSTLNDEGLLTHYFASWARQEFFPVIFFQRVRPVLSALYLPISAGGVRATLIAHVVVASLALPMLAAVARALDHRLPNLAAFAVALSPLYFFGAPAGLSNVDGVVAISLILYLLCARRRPLQAGMVAGLLPWIRPELGLFSLTMGLHALLVRRDRRLLAGLPIFPILYAAGGALYHGDALWLLHYPPSAAPDPTALKWQGQLLGLQFFLEPLLAVTPLAALVVAVRPALLKAVERSLLAYIVVTALLLNGLPMLRLANFGTSPRYSMAILPALGLLAERVLEPWWEGERPRGLALAAIGVFALWLATRQSDAVTVTVLLAAYALLLTAAAGRRGTAALALAVGLVVAGPLLTIRRDVGRTVTAPFLDPMLDWLQAHPEQLTGPLLTNSQLLAAFAEQRLPDLDIRFVAGSDISGDMTQLSNPANGQRQAILRLCATDLYGRTLFAPIDPDDVPPGALLALRVEKRLPLLLPEAVWGPRLEILADTPLFRIARVRPRGS